MGQVLRTKTSLDGKIIFYIELNGEEARSLKNHSKRVYLFSENLCNHDAAIIERGAKMGAKYVSIPLSLKSRKKTKFSEVAYQKIKSGSRVFYIAVAKKDPLSD